MKKIRLSVVIGRYYLTPRRLEKYFSSFINLVGNDLTIDVVFVDMKSDKHSDYVTNSSEKWIQKNCYYLDFSAYKEIDTSNQAELFLYINDTLFIRYPWKIIANEINKYIQAIYSLKQFVAFGDVYPYNEVLVNDESNILNKHLTTYCFILNKGSNIAFHNLLCSLPNQDDNVKQDIWINKHCKENRVLEFILKTHLSNNKTQWSWKGGSLNFNKDNLYKRKSITVILEYLLTKVVLSNGLIIPIQHGIRYIAAKKVAALSSRIRYRNYY